MELHQPINSNEQSTPQSKSTQELLDLIDRNQNIFQELKNHLMGQLESYEKAFSREHNKYTEQRIFYRFNDECEKFKKEGKIFVKMLHEIKKNCTTIIKNLPEQEKVIPIERHNSFDMFVNEQVQMAFQHKIKSVEYESDVQKPFDDLPQQFEKQ